MAKYFLFAVDKLLIFKLDSSGRAVGNTADPEDIDASSDTVSLPAHVVTHTVTVASGGATFATAVDRGGSKWRGSNSIGLEDPGTVTLTFSNWDTVFDALVTGAQLDSTYNTGVTRGGRDDLRDVPPLVGVLAFVKSAERENPTERVGVIGRYYVGQIRGSDPELNQNGGVNPSPLSYTMTLQPVRYEPTGVPLSAITNLVYSDDSALVHPMNLNYKSFMVETFVMDGTDTTVTLQYLPLYDDATASGRNIIAKNGVQTAVTSVDTATGVVTLPAAGDEGDTWVIIYPTQFVEV